MLEPLFRCNLACAGCGKIQYPAHILKKELTPEEMLQGCGRMWHPDGFHSWWRAADAFADRQDCGRSRRAKEVYYLCTNALLLKEKLHLFKPSKYLTFSVHVDGQKEHHDFSVAARWIRSGD